jgi:hypothetical protein
MFSCRFKCIHNSAEYVNLESNLDLKDFNYNSNENLFKLLILLFNKYEKLESDYNELKKHVAISKSKIDILDYLNNQCKDEYLSTNTDFYVFTNKLIINKDSLEVVFKYDYLEGIYKLYTDYINNVKNNLLIPLKAFKQKEGQLYIFVNRNWLLVSDEHISYIINYFNKKLLILFLEWKKEAENIYNNDDFGDIYVQNMKKVIAGNFKNKNINYLFKNKLYKYLQINLKNITTYDFY